MQRRRNSSPPGSPPRDANRAAGGGGRLASHRQAQGGGIDWAAFLRRLERKRRLLARANGNAPLLPADYFVRATCVSFAMEGLAVSADEARDALAPSGERKMLRSRLAQRVRNHAAILHHIESDLRNGTALAVDQVIRWYTTISAGLSTAALDAATEARLDEQVRRINSPQLRLAAALNEVAENHVRLLADPIVPSFNGILARLLLRYHLGRCKLPPVIFDAAVGGREMGVEGMVRRLVELLEGTYDELIGVKS